MPKGSGPFKVLFGMIDSLVSRTDAERLPADICLDTGTRDPGPEGPYGGIVDLIGLLQQSLVFVSKNGTKMSPGQQLRI